MSAEYSLSIPHDVPGLIEACGGKDAFIRRLDTFFANGHFNVANEPSFMTPYLYHWVERPDLSIQRIQQIVNDNYDDSPDGLPGNDDGGAMSSWLVFNMLGFYPIAGQNLYIVGSPMIPEYTIHLSNGKDLKVVREGELWKQMFITHDVLISGGKLVLPDFKTEEKGVDKTQKLLIMKGKEKSTVFAQSVDKYLITIPTQYVARFILNRQYRNWEVGIDSTSMADTLILKCNQSLYLIPRKVVDEADGFCWDSPQKGRNLYVCDMSSNRGMRDGTFLFISRKALRQLLANGSFVYNGILWRKISADEKRITVKAEQDGTVMQIAVNLGLPWVLRMDGNPLGIDWRLEKQ